MARCRGAEARVFLGTLLWLADTVATVKKAAWRGFPVWEKCRNSPGYAYFLDSFNKCLFFHRPPLGYSRLHNPMTNL